jgi:hypothetical protein
MTNDPSIRRGAPKVTPLSSKKATNESVCKRACRAYPGLFEYLSTLPNGLKWHDGYVAYDNRVKLLRIRCFQDGAPKMAGQTESEPFYLELTPERCAELGIQLPAEALT